MLAEEPALHRSFIFLPCCCVRLLDITTPNLPSQLGLDGRCCVILSHYQYNV